MAYGVTCKVWGDYACFTRPEMKAERVSYDVMTPSAARGILTAIYWKPAIRWVIDRITVLRPIRFENIRRNELAAQGPSGVKVPKNNVLRAMKDGESPVEVFIEDKRQQRAGLVLRDVAYRIEAHFEFASGEDNNEGKHLDIFNRRLAKGQCFHRPYLGCREFAAEFAPDDGEQPHPELTGERDLGWMLHDIDYDNGMQPHFFRSTMRDGVIEVPAFEETRA
ncbi:MAG: type I-C CRISPR-associated protein Cas5c [Desulfohalobiaceae bacterium]